MPQQEPTAEHKTLAKYIIEWLGYRNGGELQPSLDDMRVQDFRLMHEELEWILLHGGHPPNWVPRPEVPSAFAGSRICGVDDDPDDESVEPCRKPRPCARHRTE
jgi:hypothetical protein